MRYKLLVEPCKSCLGCQRLENPNFTGDKNCKYAEKEKGTTQYYGKWKGYEIETKTKKIHIETMVMKKYFKVLLLED